jgi:uncharacterized protein YdiU (UPF0061 family)
MGISSDAFHAWMTDWRRHLVPTESEARMRLANPAFIPRNHRVEEVIEAGLGGDFQPFETLVAVLGKPYEDQPQHAGLAEPPSPEQRVRQTFCGT